MSVKSKLENLEKGDTFTIKELGSSDDSGEEKDFKGEHTITKKSKYLSNTDRGMFQKIKEKFQIEVMGEDFALETDHDNRHYNLVIKEDKCPIVHLDSGDAFFIKEVEI